MAPQHRLTEHSPTDKEAAREVTLSLPASLIDRIHEVATAAQVTREQLIIEWLKLGSLLNTVGFLHSSPEGTVFDQFPIVDAAKGSLFTSMTNRQLADYTAKMAAVHPEEPVRGMAFLVHHDQANDVEEMLKALGARSSSSPQRGKEPPNVGTK